MAASLQVENDSENDEGTPITFDFTKKSLRDDVTFLIEDNRLYANKAILGIASPVFEAMFGSVFTERDQEEIPLPGKKFEDFKEFLHCLYPKSQRKISIGNVYRVLPLADEYNVQPLIKECKQFLGSNKMSEGTTTQQTVTDTTPLAQTAIRQRTPLTEQETSSSTSLVGQVARSVSQVRTKLQTTTSTTALTPVQLLQRTSAATTLSSGSQGKTALTPQQFQLLKQQQQTLINRQKQQAAIQQQQQQLRTMKKLATAGQLKASTSGTTQLIRPLSTPKQQESQPGLGQKAPQMLNAVQIIQQQGRGLTVQQLHQLVKQQSQGGGAIQKITHTSQPTTIATVTQGQATPQMVTKVIPTTATEQAPQIQQTIQGAAQIVGSSVTVTTVSVPSSLISSLPQGQSSMTTSNVKPRTVTGVEAVTTVQIHPKPSITQTTLTEVPQNVVVTPVQFAQHVTVAAQVGSQQVHISAGSQAVVTTPSIPTQTLQVTVPAPTQVQAPGQHLNVQQAQAVHAALSGQRGVSSSTAPLTVTPNPLSTPANQSTAVAYTSTTQAQPQRADGALQKQ